MTASLPEYEVYALRYGDQGHDLVPAGSLMLSASDDQMIPSMAYYVWVIRGNGLEIMVDTGFAPALTERLGSRLHFAGPEGLRRLGGDPDKVSDVIITHAHYDHVGNLTAFPQARFHIDAEMMPVVDGSDPCHWFFRQGYGKRDCATIMGFKAEERLIEHPHFSRPWPGIDLIHLGGHCRGQMAVQVQTKRGPIVLASDAVHLYQEWEEERPFGVFYNMRDMLAGYQTLKGLSGGKRENMIPGHDGAVMTMFPAPGPELLGQAVALHEEPEA